MKTNVLSSLLLCNLAITAAGVDAYAQLRNRPDKGQGTNPALAAPAAPAAPAPAPAPANAGDAGAKPAVGANVTATADTQGLTQFEPGVDYKPRAEGDKVTF